MEEGRKRQGERDMLHSGADQNDGINSTESCRKRDQGGHLNPVGCGGDAGGGTFRSLSGVVQCPTKQEVDPPRTV